MADDAVLPLFRCSKCGSEMPLSEFPPSKARNSGQWCRGCLRADQRRIKGLTATDRAVTCGCCSTVFRTSYTKALYCSRECKTNARNRAKQAAVDAAKPQRTCRWCGAAMAQTMRSDAKFCSADCNMQAHRKTRNLRRRQGAAAPVKPRLIPLLNLAEFAELHDHRCGICGDVVDMSLRYPEPMCVSIDHVLPRSAGGTDDIANLQLAHLTCNVTKRDRMV